MSFDRDTVEAHVNLLHELAADCGSGVLVLTPIWENRNPCAQKFTIGQAREMADAIMAFDGPGMRQTWEQSRCAASPPTAA